MCSIKYRISHPYGPLGGDLHNNVVREVTYLFAQSGFSTLRYNMRGVSKSTGRTSWTAQAEVDDLMELCAWWTSSPGAASQEENEEHQVNLPTQRPKGLILVGYSFGSLISLAAAQRGHQQGFPIVGVVAISPPTRYIPLLTCFHTDFFNSLRLAPDIKTLFMFGKGDQFSSSNHMATFSHNITSSGDTEGSPPLLDVSKDHSPNHLSKIASGNTTIVSITEGDHFWIGKEDILLDLITVWIEKLQ
jgi:alpha/beta superfamily hydrolase